ncbi:hypothetical protein WA026_018127 [Henosepilachna vigintioctopunctata]|uniref:Programmed cell death protein 2 C-terminal domain-containing protein n=1 Tax=Henosepilachna vigintioctopunctata TaxID=420089 RepID=A0AAW1UGY8_9CUCU
MAKMGPQVFLGFEDEIVTEKNKYLLNFKTNKIGGKADIPNNIKWEHPVCSLCQFPQPLIVQVYSPLDNSRYHRTLYIYACVNPNCWNQNESWTCLRVQMEDSVEETTPFIPKTNTMQWCADADDWDDDNNMNELEENGNVISPERISDEDEESFSLDESIRFNLGNLTVDDKNANIGAQGGAVGRQNSPAASAEIEGDEGEIITIDSPVMPQHDIAALLHETTPLPVEICSGVANSKRCNNALYFSPLFMSVWEESYSPSNVTDKHVKDLLQEYQSKEDFNISHVEIEDGADSGSKENYEKGVPAHGDKMFHYFLSRIQKNPGQILRYCRDNEGPLFLYPQMDIVGKCQYCQAEKVFEVQILPTIIPILKLHSDAKPSTRLEFGTALVYTCKNSCWSLDTPVRQETVIVQKEIL